VSDWLELTRRDAPLIVCFPHTGLELPAQLADRFVSAWRARKDADHHVHTLYAPAHQLGATTLRTTISRSVIDVNRDPSGASLYPGQATTELCPLTTFDGEPLYVHGAQPSAAEIEQRRATWFEPYHAALRAEIERLRAKHPRVLVFDAHAIRSRIPRLFPGELPELNLGTNDGRSCEPRFEHALRRVLERSGRSWVVNGRFKGGWTTRHYAAASSGVHALQLELSCRAYLAEPEQPDASNWPPAFEAARAAPLQQLLAQVLQACLAEANRRDHDPQRSDP
jgi:N-formylglutamate deformylase